jgi:outer membrane receptor protein involved in Fe transport
MKASSLSMAAKKTSLMRGKRGAFMRTAVSVAVACLSIVGTGVAADAEATMRRQTDIQSQSLDSALQSLAKDRNFQIVYPYEIVGERETDGIHGELTFEEALTQLLTGTKLQYRFLDEKTVTIVPIPTAPATTPSAPAPSAAPQTGGREPVPASEAENKSFWSRLRLAQSRAAASSSSTPASTEPALLEEVLVTAQRREERLRDVPISISVLNGADLDRATVKDVNEVLNQVPGVTTTAGFQVGGSQVAVRGVAANGAIYSGASPIGYYFDWIPFGFIKSAVAPDLNAYDLERVEVLRGPQGTLYGASAQNGVVRVLTHDADMNDFDFKARTSVSSIAQGSDSYRGDIAANVPFVPGQLAGRLVVGHQRLGGWIDKPNASDVNSADVTNIRLRLKATPSDALSIGLVGWHSKTDADGFATGFENDFSRAVNAEPLTVETNGAGVKLDYNFNRFSVSSMTSYLHYNSDGYVDYSVIGLADTVLHNRFDSKLKSEEINLNSTGTGYWRWSAGGIYREVTDELYQFRRQYIAGPNDFANESKSWAVFGQLTRLFLDGRFELAAGVRYFNDDVTGTELSRNSALLPGQTFVQTDDTFVHSSPRVTFTWHATDHVTAYASYAEGFRSGFPQNPNITAAAPQFPPLDSDNLANYEIGTKGTVGALTFDAAVFYVDWRDVQQNLTVNAGTATSPIPVAAFVNASSASGLGFEFGIDAKLATGLDAGLTFSWNGLEMDEDVFTHPSGAPPEGVLLFAKGDRLNQSAKYTGGAYVNYEFPLGAAGLQGRVSVSGNYSSALYFHTILSNQEYIARGDEFFIGRASFGMDFPNNLAVSVFADNFTNRKGVTNPYPSPVDWSTHRQPRTIGIQLDYHL